MRRCTDAKAERSSRMGNSVGRTWRCREAMATSSAPVRSTSVDQARSSHRLQTVVKGALTQTHNPHAHAHATMRRHFCQGFRGFFLAAWPAGFLCDRGLGGRGHEGLR